MVTTVAVKIFQFDELSDTAKESAREWYRDGAFDYHWWDAIYEDAERIAEILGIEFKQYKIPLMNGKTRDEWAIMFSGFWSQGDGACFEGWYGYKKGAAKAIREYAPQDEILHRIADDLQAAQRPEFYELTATITHRGNYSHAHTMQIDVNRDGYSAAAEPAEAVCEALRDFANWIYRALEREYEWLNADEQVDDSIRANEYTFEEDGTRSRW